ncbi:MAG TPA: ATP-dependent RNA helicase HrpA, partial [Gammaproteobacteria bacterium]|nr:ATP-dependent RNA helicase HrpA [Gammaproteobacteria bacterium]
MNQKLNKIKAQLSHCMIKDRFLLSRELSSYRKAPALNQKKLELFTGRVNKSIELAKQRLQCLPEISYPEELPVVEKRHEIKKLIQDNQVLILSGETGSGKTTQIPKICLELGLGVKGLIGHTQPRRIAARSVATRIATELKTEIGGCVGFKVRFSDHVSPLSHIKLMTDGILLAEIQSDRYLLQYEVLIIDEAHERSLNIDFILGYLKTILKKRPDLKIIVTSATIDTKKFSQHFSNAPIIEVTGRTFPVQVLYHPLDQREDEPSLVKAISEAIFELNRQQAGDTLVFLPGEREIREAAEYLRKHHPPHTEILPLYSRLTVKEQQRVFSSHAGRRVVLATNVAETSLTVPGIRYVIDAGLVRMSRYSIRSRIQRLPIEPVSQAAANQRAGRCGRVSAGTCIRLYSEADFINRPLFTDPEILRVNLAGVILQMKMLKIGDVFEFPFINMPEKKYINDGIKLLEELGAIDAHKNITETGKIMGRFSVDPRLGRMLVEANREGSLAEVLIITAFLTIQDPRERPFDAQQKADACHTRFEDTTSDFLSILKLWAYYQEQSRHLTQNKFRKLCKKEFLSYLRLREWKDILTQLKNAVADAGLKANPEAAGYEQIHRALLSGLLSNIGFRQDDSLFQGAKQKKFSIFPGSNLKKKPPKWVMAAEIVETNKNFARHVAKINPEWIVNLAKHLLNRHYFDPHWQKNAEQVGAFEKISLYGITIIPKQRINYGPIDPQTSRTLFIRHALIYGEMKQQAPFLKHNLKKIQAIESMEHKSRRQDILVSEDEIFDFYDKQLPEKLYSGHDFRKWYRAAQKNNQKLLMLEEKNLIRESASQINALTHPDTLAVKGFQFKLIYYFHPGSENDGVSVRIPVGVLSQVEAHWFEWLLPGLLREKIIALIKSLPKS